LTLVDVGTTTNRHFAAIQGTDDDVDADADAAADNKPVWPTWAVGALFRVARCTHINYAYFHIPLSSRGYCPVITSPIVRPQRAAA
jgi:hypothetical protein